jgi:hypothetical protein
MIKNLVLLILISSTIAKNNLKAQVYSENSGEVIFAFSEVEKKGTEIPTKMRFTLFFHVGQNFHYDFSNNVGVFSGFGIRNIGVITDENDILFKRRTYSLGVPLALKLGSFKDHTYFYTGGEFELFFHYRQKQYINGNKSDHGEWFSNRTKRFAPSLFAGIQFPGGINLKFKYYPENFLNTKFKGNDFGAQVDYSEFNKTQLFYLALSFNFKNKDIKKLYNPDSEPGRIACL